VLPVSKLRKHTHLKTKAMKISQQSLTFEMILWYTKIRHGVPVLEIQEIDEHLLTVKEN
jgi:hypothetical protein